MDNEKTLNEATNCMGQSHGYSEGTTMSNSTTHGQSWEHSEGISTNHSIISNNGFLNQPLTKHTVKIFFAGVCTTIVVGLLGYMLGCCTSQNRLQQPPHLFKEHHQNIENFDRDNFYFGSTMPDEHKKIHEFFFEEGGQFMSNDYCITEKNGHTTITVYNPDKVIVNKDDGKIISGHYYIEDVSNGKTVLRADKTVEVKIMAKGEEKSNKK